MSHLAKKLEEVLKQKNLQQLELSRLTGISTGQISRLVNGEQKWISPTDLESICTALSTVPAEQAGIIVAHLWDECSGPGRELIDIRVDSRRTEPLRETPHPYGSPLAPKLERALEVLRRHGHDKDLRELLLSLAEVMERHPTPSAPYRLPRKPKKPRGGSGGSRLEIAET